MDLFGKKKIRELEDKFEILSDSIDAIARGHEYERSWYSGKTDVEALSIVRCWDKTKTYSTQSIKDLTIQEFFDFYFDGKPIKRKEEVDVEYRRGE